ncbi:MAG: hypothetical protein U9N83_16190 [Thermodesulfobacteriota bacterium]|nr:hypothetical protein [Thermodesulfobacteriota bacterium]
MEDDVFYTRTMAKVYADQGNLGKAAEIYNYLLKQEPGRQDLIDALSEIENRGFDKDRESLFMLFSEWIDLLIKFNGIHKLKKLQRYIGDQR